MNKRLTPDDQKILDVLDRAVLKALDRKRRLGQYAVIWRNGKVVVVPPEDLPRAQERAMAGKDEIAP